MVTNGVDIISRTFRELLLDFFPFMIHMRLNQVRRKLIQQTRMEYVKFEQ